MAAIPEANATALPASSPPTTSSSASQVGVPSSREYSRPMPIMKFDAGIGGTFWGAPGVGGPPARYEPRFRFDSRRALLHPSNTSREEVSSGSKASLTHVCFYERQDSRWHFRSLTLFAIQ